MADLGKDMQNWVHMLEDLLGKGKQHAPSIANTVPELLDQRDATTATTQSPSQLQPPQQLDLQHDEEIKSLLQRYPLLNEALKPFEPLPSPYDYKAQNTHNESPWSSAQYQTNPVFPYDKESTQDTSQKDTTGVVQPPQNQFYGPGPPISNEKMYGGSNAPWPGFNAVQNAPQPTQAVTLQRPIQIAEENKAWMQPATDQYTSTPPLDNMQNYASEQSTGIKDAEKAALTSVHKWPTPQPFKFFDKQATAPTKKTKPTVKPRGLEANLRGKLHPGSKKLPAIRINPFLAGSEGKDRLHPWPFSLKIKVVPPEGGNYIMRIKGPLDGLPGANANLDVAQGRSINSAGLNRNANAASQNSKKYIKPMNRNYQLPPSEEQDSKQNPIVYLKVPRNHQKFIELTTQFPNGDASRGHSRDKILSMKLPFNVSLATVLKNIYENMFVNYLNKKPSEIIEEHNSQVAPQKYLIRDAAPEPPKASYAESSNLEFHQDVKNAFQQVPVQQIPYQQTVQGSSNLQEPKKDKNPLQYFGKIPMQEKLMFKSYSKPKLPNLLPKNVAEDPKKDVSSLRQQQEQNMKLEQERKMKQEKSTKNEVHTAKSPFPDAIHVRVLPGKNGNLQTITQALSASAAKLQQKAASMPGHANTLSGKNIQFKSPVQGQQAFMAQMVLQKLSREGTGQETAEKKTRNPNAVPMPLNEKVNQQNRFFKGLLQQQIKARLPAPGKIQKFDAKYIDQRLNHQTHPYQYTVSKKLTSKGAVNQNAMQGAGAFGAGLKNNFRVIQGSEKGAGTSGSKLPLDPSHKNLLPRKIQALAQNTQKLINFGPLKIPYNYLKTPFKIGPRLRLVPVKMQQLNSPSLGNYDPKKKYVLMPNPVFGKDVAKLEANGKRVTNLVQVKSQSPSQMGQKKQSPVHLNYANQIEMLRALQGNKGTAGSRVTRPIQTDKATLKLPVKNIDPNRMPKVAGASLLNIGMATPKIGNKPQQIKSDPFQTGTGLPKTRNFLQQPKGTGKSIQQSGSSLLRDFLKGDIDPPKVEQNPLEVRGSNQQAGGSHLLSGSALQNTGLNLQKSGGSQPQRSLSLAEIRDLNSFMALQGSEKPEDSFRPKNPSMMFEGGKTSIDSAYARYNQPIATQYSNNKNKDGEVLHLSASISPIRQPSSYSVASASEIIHQTRAAPIFDRLHHNMPQLQADSGESKFKAGAARNIANNKHNSSPQNQQSSHKQMDSKASSGKQQTASAPYPQVNTQNIQNSAQPTQNTVPISNQQNIPSNYQQAIDMQRAMPQGNKQASRPQQNIGQASTSQQITEYSNGHASSPHNLGPMVNNSPQKSLPSYQQERLQEHLGPKITFSPEKSRSQQANLQHDTGLGMETSRKTLEINKQQEMSNSMNDALQKSLFNSELSKLQAFTKEASLKLEAEDKVQQKFRQSSADHTLAQKAKKAQQESKKEKEEKARIQQSSEMLSKFLKENSQNSVKPDDWDKRKSAIPEKMSFDSDIVSKSWIPRLHTIPMSDKDIIEWRKHHLDNRLTQLKKKRDSGPQSVARSKAQFVRSKRT